MRAGFLFLVLAFTTVFLAGAYAQPKTLTLTETNHTKIIGPVNGESIERVMTDIAKSDPNQPFFLYLQSPGGEVFAGKQLSDYLSSTTRPIHCIANTAISMAYVILQACPVRLVTPNAVLMMHHISAGAQGTITQMNSAIKVMQALEDLVFKNIADRFGISVKEFADKVGIEWWTMGGDKIVDSNQADKVVKVNCTAELEKKGLCPLL